jgi:hypothetical protein
MKHLDIARIRASLIRVSVMFFESKSKDKYASLAEDLVLASKALDSLEKEKDYQFSQAKDYRTKWAQSKMENRLLKEKIKNMEKHLSI